MMKKNTMLAIVSLLTLFTEACASAPGVNDNPARPRPSLCERIPKWIKSTALVAGVSYLLQSHVANRAKPIIELDNEDNAIETHYPPRYCPSPEPFGDTQVCKKYIPSELETLKILGTGGGGSAHLVQDKDGKCSVMKQLTGSFKRKYSETEKEVRVMKRLDENQDQNTMSRSYTTPFQGQVSETEYLTKVYSGGSLERWIDKLGGKLDFENTRIYAGQMYRGLQIMHDNGIVHGDVKPANCLVDDKGRLYLSDFGLSEEVGSDANGSFYSGFLSDVRYMPPERGNWGCRVNRNLSENRQYQFSLRRDDPNPSPFQRRLRRGRHSPCNKAVDVWAFGKVVYEMLTGNRKTKSAFSDTVFSGIKRVDEEIHGLKIDFDDRPWKLPQLGLKKEQRTMAQEVIDGCFQMDPAERLDHFNSLKTHRFFIGDDPDFFRKLDDDEIGEDGWVDSVEPVDRVHELLHPFKAFRGARSIDNYMVVENTLN